MMHFKYSILEHSFCSHHWLSRASLLNCFSLMMRLSKTFNEGGCLLRDDYEESIGAPPTFIRASSVGVMIGNGSRAPIILPVPLGLYEGSHLPGPLSPTPFLNLNLALHYYYIRHLIGLSLVEGILYSGSYYVCLFLYDDSPIQTNKVGSRPHHLQAWFNLHQRVKHMCIVHSGSRSRPHHLELAQFVREISGYNWPYPSVCKSGWLHVVIYTSCDRFSILIWGIYHIFQKNDSSRIVDLKSWILVG